MIIRTNLEVSTQLASPLPHSSKTYSRARAGLLEALK
jgi:hypothetical protein